MDHRKSRTGATKHPHKDYWLGGHVLTSISYLNPGAVAYARNMSALSGSMFVFSPSSSSSTRVATGRPTLHCAAEDTLHLHNRVHFRKVSDLVPSFVTFTARQLSGREVMF